MPPFGPEKVPGSGNLGLKAATGAEGGFPAGRCRRATVKSCSHNKSPGETAAKGGSAISQYQGTAFVKCKVRVQQFAQGESVSQRFTRANQVCLPKAKDKSKRAARKRSLFAQGNQQTQAHNAQNKFVCPRQIQTQARNAQNKFVCPRQEQTQARNAQNKFVCPRQVQTQARNAQNKFVAPGKNKCKRATRWSRR